MCANVQGCACATVQGCARVSVRVFKVGVCVCVQRVSVNRDTIERETTSRYTIREKDYLMRNNANYLSI